ncbi:hypothetical protein HDC92_005080 [Pedobacter sp. AK017]|uniref:OmpA family protein n=1 Tax=Pedobacter sp. AK017 TaxID=2723073 RepID=UPI0016171EB2|nr:OmpA family protein [Pedobacter sp. AK017]MBB5441372.1 hypothetical protein [Pedobacter sp. AK017]
MLDYAHTTVLLIGASSFPEDPEINPIPNVEVNIALFKKYLIDDKYIGIPESNIIVSLNENRISIERHLRDATMLANHKKHALIVYYTGHGLLSSIDYKLFLSTAYTSRKDLEIEGFNIDDFKKYIRRSNAGTKIVILDCCHSGAMIGILGAKKDMIQANLKGFEGTYVMTSAAEHEPALFPYEFPHKPTFFTGRFLDIVENGLDIDSDYCSLRDIFNDLQRYCKTENLPTPQQSNYNNADRVLFCRNNSYLNREIKEEADWERTELADTLNAYQIFLVQYPDSAYVPIARSRLLQLEEDRFWNLALKKNSISTFRNYIRAYPKGIYVDQAIEMVNLIKAEQVTSKEAELVPEPVAAPIIENVPEVPVQKIKTEPKEAAKMESEVGKSTSVNVFFLILTGCIVLGLIVLIYRPFLFSDKKEQIAISNPVVIDSPVKDTTVIIPAIDPTNSVIDSVIKPETKIKDPKPIVYHKYQSDYVISFEYNSSVLKTESYLLLDKLSSILRENGDDIELRGYYSSEKTASYALTLSRYFANSVKTYLVNSGVNPNKITIKAFGERDPVASNETEDGRIRNRRVECVVKEDPYGF